MDLLNELEGMASSALSHADNEDWDPNEPYTPKTPVSRPIASSPSSQDSVLDVDFLVKLEGPISSSHRISEILGTSKPLPTSDGESNEDGHVAKFCKLTPPARQTLLSWARDNNFRPLIISQSRAPKDFWTRSIPLKIGMDTALPQHRLTNLTTPPRPAHDEYPVWYFFYGTLADAAILRRLFSELDDETTTYELYPAAIRGGTLKTASGGRYKALLNGADQDAVDGHAFLVRSKEHEDALCVYETRAYEVVRCDISIAGQEDMVPGCTFRFRGQVD
ncbi:hypothetical protein LTR09_007310 [Extremus antarcticus]|uniref:Putative gamma-glutamylcyclotransferase n=1 Tax=Extremus antarcticus TaxID=702011 RepID=A0AAJ0DCX5_9PEZI|nr:hypothetical protein LTR09_007310 [Extremus antarcticus]